MINIPPSAPQSQYQDSSYRRGHHQHTSSFSAAQGYPSSSFPQSRIARDPTFVEKVKQTTDKVEDYLDAIFHPLKPWLPAVGRFLIVVTFLEDAIRIVSQWSDQLHYLHRYRKFWWGFSHAFLSFNVLAMLAGSYLIMSKRYPEVAVAVLLVVVIAQGIGYGLITDISFFLRNLSVIGGLLMVLSDSLSKNKSIFAGLPSLEISETDRKKYFQLAGRVLLIFLFIAFIINGKWTLFKAFVSLIGLGASIMVVVGFKARFSAMFLVGLLSIFNVIVNNFWSVHPNHPQRDFLKYDFFQTLSILGGLILLADMGAGGISVDERKKNF